MATQPKSMQQLWQDSYLASGSESYLEDLYEKYLENPQNVTPEWRHYFERMLQQNPFAGPDVAHSAVREQFAQLARQSRAVAVQGMETFHDQQQERVIELINAYRRLGHLRANIDPLGLSKGSYSPMLELSYYGFSNQDLKKTFSAESFTVLNKDTASLEEIYQALQRVYCGTIGFEYMHINRAEEVEWIRNRIEQNWVNFTPSKEEKLRILDRLIVADGLEKYLSVKYVGQKRFSLEGGDSLISLLDTALNRGAQNGIKEVTIGMAHRGRLNVLVNIVGKKSSEIFAAFEGKGISKTSGDVKYHLGYSSNVNTQYGSVHVALAFNPSHLEIVSPVVQGAVRARQRRRSDTDQRQVIPIQIPNHR